MLSPVAHRWAPFQQVSTEEQTAENTADLYGLDGHGSEGRDGQRSAQAGP